MIYRLIRNLLYCPSDALVYGRTAFEAPRPANKLVNVVLAFSTLATVAAGQDVLTSRNDPARSGVQRHETILNHSNVQSSRFRFLRSLAVDGQVYAQPLYVSAANVFVNGVSQGRKNLLYVATENDSIYCFDADNGRQYWKRSLLLPGETAADSAGCEDLTPENGITGTPVIDRNAGPNGTIYAVSFSLTTSHTYTYRVNALDIGTGNPVLGPTTIDATVAGNGPGNNGDGTVSFRPATQRQREGLALANGNVYIGFGSICDAEPFTGWLLAYSQQSLTQVSAFNANPNGTPLGGTAGSSGAGIWQSGMAPVIAPGSGNLVVVTGNGPLGYSQQDYSDTVLQLKSAGNLLTVADYFTPASFAVDEGDDDLGSGGGIAFNVGGHSLFAISGKDSNLYLLDFSKKWAQFNGSNNNYIYQEVDQAFPGGVFGGPAFYNRALYYGHSGGPLLQFTFDSTAKLPAEPTSSSPESFNFPGVIPSISANNNKAGVVWVIDSASGGPAVLHAYAANNLGRELFTSTVNFGAGVKFSVPTIAGGKVYVGTQSTVGVFGLK